MKKLDLFLTLIFLIMASVSWGQTESTIFSGPLETPRVSNEVSSPFLLGHNLTPTTYTLKKGQTTLGTYGLAYGITDSWMIGTSPEFFFYYNMPMINSRILLFQQNGFRIATDLSYFKTYERGPNFYDQESGFARLTGSKRFSDFYTMHVSSGFQYFWVDVKPYSFRLVPGNTDPYNISASTLHEMHWFKHLGTFLEAGFMGLNYQTPYLHLGASMFANWHWGNLVLGLSRTSSMGQVHCVTADSDFYFTDIVYHPEVQFQTFF